MAETTATIVIDDGDRIWKYTHSGQITMNELSLGKVVLVPQDGRRWDLEMQEKDSASR